MAHSELLAAEATWAGPLSLAGLWHTQHAPPSALALQLCHTVLPIEPAASVCHSRGRLVCAAVKMATLCPS